MKNILALSSLSLFVFMAFLSPAQAQIKRICVWGSVGDSDLYYTVSTPTRNVQYKERVHLYDRWDCFRVDGPIHRVFFQRNVGFGIADKFDVMCDFNNIVEDGAFYLKGEMGWVSNFPPIWGVKRIECVQSTGSDPIPRQIEPIFKVTLPPAENSGQ